MPDPRDRVRGGGGAVGSKTRTWFSVKEQPLFAWAGLWRHSDVWEPVYSGVMADCNEAIRPVHDRMPVLLMPEEWDRCMHRSLEDVVGFQSRCSPDDLIEMRRTVDLWLKRSTPRWLKHRQRCSACGPAQCQAVAPPRVDAVSVEARKRRAPR
ncbi:MAG: hypothetical protein JWR10_1278 [Rubritepida sp.]|nr:hypothetical protein [Rubritepida sp.]